MSADVVTVGARAVDMSVARDWVNAYVNGRRGQFGYPSYDGYRTNDDPYQLCDGDLLAPVLLNVQVKISSFADLCACRDQLDAALTSVPVDVDLVSADDAVLTRVGNLFGVLDSQPRPRSVLGTTLAKVLHRKRPSLVPLYDEQVRRVYQDGDDAPVPPLGGRAWVDFMTLLVRAMQQDLKRALDFWDELTTLAPPGGPPVSHLRALDIVAWRLGETEHRP